MERYCVNLVLSWNTLVSPSMVIESLAGYSSLGWHLCSLSVCITSVQDLLTFIVSGEKSGVILIGLTFLEFCWLLVYSWASLSLGLRSFCYNFVEDICWPFKLKISILIYSYYPLVWSSHCVLDFLDVLS